MRTISIPIPDDLFLTLRSHADANERTLAADVRYLVRQALDKEHTSASPKPKFRLTPKGQDLDQE